MYAPPLILTIGPNQPFKPLILIQIPFIMKIIQEFIGFLVDVHLVLLIWTGIAFKVTYIEWRQLTTD